MIRAVLISLALASYAAVVGAQEKLTVSQPEPGTIRLNQKSVIRIRVEGADANPRSPELPEVDGLEIKQLPASTSSQMVFNGRRRVTKVSVEFGLELRPQRAGIFVIPPFNIWTGTQNQQTREMRLEVREDLISQELSWLDVELEDARVYVHEPVRMKITFGILEGVRLAENLAQTNAGQQRYFEVFLAADWLDTFPVGESMPIEQPQGDVRLFVINRELARAKFLSDYERDGKGWQCFQVERSFLPSKVGKVELVAPTLRFSSMRYKRGRIRGGQKDSFGIAGDSIALEVMPIPEAGRPSPYFGAVGRFSIEAALDRDRIRFGDSFKLTLTVRGQGNLEFLRMPDLSSLTGFHKRGAAEAVRDENRVVVTYDLTPLSADVDEIPSIAWNYFDTTPGVEAFIEVETKPLTVVVDAIENGESIASLPESAVAAVTPGVDDIFDLPPFDVAVISNPQPSLLLRGIAVFSPWALVLLAFAWMRSRRLASLDVAGKRARGAKRSFDAALQRGDDAMDAIAVYLGDRVDIPPAAVISSDLAGRLGEHGLDAAVANDVASAIERGTAARYGGGQALTAEDARALVHRLEGVRFGARCLLPFLLLPLLAFTSADLNAQEAEARHAYRAGEYQKADEAFVRAYNTTQNRLYMRARGNCLYRLGDLARARWAYETARVALPRDPELLANLRLVRTRLELLEVEGGLTGELQRLLDRYTLSERTIFCMVCMLLAAGCLVFGFHRLGWRWLGITCLSAGLLLALDVLWLAPGRPLQGVVLRELPVTSEPRSDMEAVAVIRPGAIVDLLGGRGGDFLRVDASGRSGYVAADAIAVVE